MKWARAQLPAPEPTVNDSSDNVLQLPQGTDEATLSFFESAVGCGVRRY